VSPPVTPEFREFPKIARLNREVIVTEKIDGTNGLVFVGEDGTIAAGSRSRFLCVRDPAGLVTWPCSDNHGFGAWVLEHAEELKQLGPGYHYGEWWGRGINKRYDVEPKRFSLFNVSRWGETRPACCGVVPVLWRGPEIRYAVETALALLRSGGSLAAPGCIRPEGVVAFHVASGQSFKVTLEKDEERKGNAP
jgi:RNA ligase